MKAQEKQPLYRFQMRSRIIESLLPWQRVLLRIEVDYATDCWLYTGSVNADGYAELHWTEDGTSKKERAHRIIARFFKGPIPDGLAVLHRCDTPACVNPAHLWYGTQKQNMEDAVAKGRIKRTFAPFDAKLESKRKYMREYMAKRRKF